MNKIITTFALMASLSVGVFAQRAQTPALDRGLVAVKTDGGVFCSWRISGEEYYDVTYNLFRDGVKLNDKPLAVSNFVDAAGSLASKYTVSAIVRGVEQPQCEASEVLENNYLLIKPQHAGKANYEPNDATIADLDGDGKMELIIKFVCTDYHWNGYSTDATEFDIIEAYKISQDKQEIKPLWWIDCGPNMTDFQSNEINIACYDWDGDGKAECVMRAADKTVIHQADGTAVTIGDPTYDCRSVLLRGSGQTFTFTGAEYLLYFNGETAELYANQEYPLKRLETGETDLNAAWGDGYGHRSSKHFFGAPYFDGHKPSIFLARGIYTRHKMIALDVDPATHQLSTRWSWANNTWGDWYGQGYHNYSIADVDWDGRDEIVFGSMVIDDNGKGLSSTGLGHGDSHHVGDFNPYVHGSEFFACNEDEPNNNYRDATTSRIYYRTMGGNDDGRSMCGNFTDDIIGAGGITSRDGGTLISCVQNAHAANTTALGITQNFRIYWDGDLCEETFDYSSGKNTAGGIYKYNTSGALQILTGSMTNNDTKGTPSLQADIFGDWREEVVMRDKDGNIRIYTTTFPTEWRNYTLLDDHQYRNAMIHQMNGYNQAPHVSYFLGAAEGITLAPPPVIMRGRVRAESQLTSALNDKHAVISGNENATYTVAEGVAPYILTVNTPSWVQGCFDNDKIKYEYFTHTLTGAGFSGDMRLVKQGDGTLVLPAVEQTYAGKTDVWAGTLSFDGTMTNSPVWLNRFAVLTSDGGVFHRKVEADYASQISVAGANKVGTATIDTLVLNFGAELVTDVYPDGTADLLKVKKLSLVKAPNAKFDVLPFTKPVVKLVFHNASDYELTPAGKYLIAEVENLDGKIEDLALDGLNGHKATLLYEDGKLYLEVLQLRDPKTIYWVGNVSNVWDLANAENFVDEQGNSTYFVTGDDVIFSDKSTVGQITIDEPLRPSSVTFNAESTEYELTGDSLVGKMNLAKSGAATLTISNVNRFTGGTRLNGGSLVVSQLAYSAGSAYGALGGINDPITLYNGGIFVPKGDVKCSQKISISGDRVDLNIESGSALLLERGIGAGKTSNWYKTGRGSLTLAAEANEGILHIVQGTVNTADNCSPATIYIEGSTTADAVLHNADNIYSYNDDNSNVIVPEGKCGTWSLDARCNYKGKLTGKGSLKVNVTNARSSLQGDWSDFEGTLQIAATKTGSYDPYLNLDNSKGLPNADVTIACGTTNNGNNFALGNLSGSVTLYGAGTWTIGSLNKDVKFTGVFDGGKITKVGTGTWTLTSLQTSIATNSQVAVNGGVMNLKPTNVTDKFFGTNQVNVNDGGTLAGLATLADVNVNSGATFVPGDYTKSVAARYGVFYANNVYLFGGKLSFTLRNFKGAENSGTKLSVKSQLYAESGTIEVNVATSLLPTSTTFAKQFAEGDSYELWTAGSATLSKKNIQVILPELPAGLIWDTSDLFAKTGVIRVAKDPEYESAIRVTFAASETVEATVFGTNGAIVARFSALRSEVEALAREAAGVNGIYVVRMSVGNKFESIKVLVD